MPSPRPTRAATAQRANYHHLATTLRGLEEDLCWGLEGSARIPPEWHAIAQGPVVPKKQMMTIRLDEDVVRFFRAMGAGHQPRMNAVLRTFMQARLAGVVKGPEDVDYPRPPEAVLMEELEALLDDMPGSVERIRSGPQPEREQRRMMDRLNRLEQLLGD